jgi:hypothetical protein
VGDGAAAVAFSSMSGDLAVTRSRQQPAATEPAATAPATSRPATPAPDDRNEILRALERGDIDVDEAMRRLGENA